MPPSRALVFYGRVGTYKRRAALLERGAPGEINLWRTCALTARQQVFENWEEDGNVDVFVQSWNPGPMAVAMDAFWQPAASEHAEQNASLRCPVQMRLCERTMWALLGMKQGLALRAAYERRSGVKHATVLVARHDVYWRNPVPSVRTDGAIRLWLPFDCQVNYCHDGPANVSACWGRQPSNDSDWMLLRHSQSLYFGTRCDRTHHDARNLAICAHTVLIDWWFIADRALADGFGDTFDAFESYSRLVQDKLQLNISAPHNYWGLHFFLRKQLRAKCQVGHVMLHGLDFTLGRFLPDGVNATSTCRFGDREPWRPRWQPPREAASCEQIAGYTTMCPGVPAQRPLNYVCTDL